MRRKKRKQRAEARLAAERHLDRITAMREAEIDRLRAENAALREAGEGLIREMQGHPPHRGAIARWREVTRSGAVPSGAVPGGFDSQPAPETIAGSVGPLHRPLS